jgi:membrane-associated phospholipid phosphatase
VKAVLYDWGGANIWLFQAVNGWHGDLLDTVMQWGSILGDHDRFPLYLAALVAIAWWRVVRGAAAEPWLGVIAVFALAYVIDGVIVGWLKEAFTLPRPPAVLPVSEIHIVGAAEYKRSFPSGHAVFAATCAASLWPLLHSAGRAAAVLFVVWVTWSRIALGAHFPADIVGGALLATVVVLATRCALDTLRRRCAANK